MDAVFNLCWQQAGHVYLGDLLTPSSIPIPHLVMLS